jgi:hypothetical protein
MVLATPTEHAYLPATTDLPLFWASGALLMMLLPFAPRLSRPASTSRSSGRRNALLFIGVCFVCVAALLYPLTRWRSDEESFGQLFSWFCAHGMLAVMYSRMGVIMFLSLRRNRASVKPRPPSNHTMQRTPARLSVNLFHD